MRTHTFMVKLWSIVTVFLFTTTSLYAAPQLPTQTVLISSQGSGVSHVPVWMADGIKDFGKLTTAQSENRNIEESPYIIYIQDAHANYSAQKNMGEMIRSVSDKFREQYPEYSPKIGIAAEGLLGTPDFKAIEALSKDSVTQKVADYFMKQVFITGAEYPIFTQDTPYEYFGVDDPELLDRDVSLYLEVAKQAKELKPTLDRMRSELHRAIQTMKNEDLKALYIHKEEVMGNKGKFMDYLVFLLSHSGENSQKLSKLKKVLKLEKQINRTNLEAEKNKAGEGWQNLSAISLLFYPNIRRQLQYDRLFKRLKVADLMSEIPQLEYAVKQKLTKNTKESKFDQIMSGFQALEKFARLEMTPSDLERFRLYRPEMLKSLRKLSKSEAEWGQVQTLLDTAEAFYVVAKARDAHMIDNLLKEIENRDLDLVFLIAGGFHSEGFAGQLELNDSNYFIAVPKIHEIREQDKKVYQMRLAGSGDISTHTVFKRHVDSGVVVSNFTQSVTLANQQPNLSVVSVVGQVVYGDGNTAVSIGAESTTVTVSGASYEALVGVDTFAHAVQTATAGDQTNVVVSYLAEAGYGPAALAHVASNPIVTVNDPVSGAATEVSLLDMTGRMSATEGVTWLDANAEAVMRSEVRLTYEQYMKMAGHHIRRDIDGNPIQVHPGTPYARYMEIVAQQGAGQIGFADNFTVVQRVADKGAGEGLGSVGYAQEKPVVYADIAGKIASGEVNGNLGPEAIGRNELVYWRGAGGFAGRAIYKEKPYDVVEFSRYRIHQAVAIEKFGRPIDSWELILGHAANVGRRNGGKVTVLQNGNQWTHAFWQNYTHNELHNYGLDDDQVILYPFGSGPSLNPTLRDFKVAPDQDVLRERVETYLRNYRDFIPELARYTDSVIEKLTDKQIHEILMELNGGAGDLFTLADGSLRWKSNGHLVGMHNLISEGILYDLWKKGQRWMVYGNDTDYGHVIDEDLLSYFLQLNADENVEMMSLLILKDITYQVTIPGVNDGDDDKPFKVVYRRVRQGDTDVYKYELVETATNLPSDYTPQVDDETGALTILKDTNPVADVKIKVKPEKGGIAANINGKDVLAEAWALPEPYEFKADLGGDVGEVTLAVLRVPTLDGYKYMLRPEQSQIPDNYVFDQVDGQNVLRKVERVADVDELQPGGYRLNISSKGILKVRNALNDEIVVEDVEGELIFDPNKVAEYNPAHYIFDIEALFRAYGFASPEEFKAIDPRDAEDELDLRARYDAVDKHLQHLIDQVGQYWEIKEVVDWNSTFLAKTADGAIHKVVVDDQGHLAHNDFPSNYELVWNKVEEDGRVVYKELLQVNDASGLRVVDASNIRKYEPPRIALETGQLLGDLTFVLNNVRFVTVDRDGVNSPVAYGIPKSLDKIADYEHVIANVLGNAGKPQVDLFEDPSLIPGGAEAAQDVVITADDVMQFERVWEVKDERLAAMTRSVYDNRSEVRDIPKVAIQAEDPSLKDYLTESVANFRRFVAEPDFRTNKKVILVMGHTNPDVDAVFSAVSRAYVKHLQLLHDNVSDTIVVPVVNTLSAEEARKLPGRRGDIGHVFERLGLGDDEIVHYASVAAELPDLPLDQIDVYLTDHNELHGSQQFLRDRVREIMDHHDVARAAAIDDSYPDAEVLIKEIGSSSTLVSELITNLDSLPNPEERHDLAVVLVAGAISDTQNFKTVDKVTIDDGYLQQYIGNILGPAGTDELSDAMDEQYLKLEGVAVEAILERDPKDYEYPDSSDRSYGIRSFAVTEADTELYSSRLPEILAGLEAERQQREFPFMILNVGFRMDGLDAQVYIVAESQELATQIAQELEAKEDGLSISVSDGGFAPGYSVLSFDKQIISRKKSIQPHVHGLLNRSEVRLTYEQYMKLAGHHIRRDIDGNPIQVHPGTPYARYLEIIAEQSNRAIGLSDNFTVVQRVADAGAGEGLGVVGYAQEKPVVYADIAGKIQAGEVNGNLGPEAIGRDELVYWRGAGGFAGRAIYKKQPYDVVEFSRYRIHQAVAVNKFGRPIDSWEMILGHAANVGRRNGGKVTVLQNGNQWTHAFWQNYTHNELSNYGLDDDQVILYPFGSGPSLNPTIRDFKAAPDQKGMRKMVIAYIKRYRDFLPELEHYTDTALESITDDEIYSILKRLNGGEGGLFTLADGSLRWKSNGHLVGMHNLISEGILYDLWKRGQKWIVYGNDTDYGHVIDEDLLSYFLQLNADEGVEMMSLLILKDITYAVSIGDEKYKVVYRRVRQGDTDVYKYELVTTATNLPDKYVPTIDDETGELTITHKDGDPYVDGVSIEVKPEKGGIAANINGKDVLAEAWALPQPYEYKVDLGDPHGEVTVLALKIPTEDGNVYQVREKQSELPDGYTAEFDDQGRITVRDGERNRVAKNVEGSLTFDPNKIAEYNPAHYIFDIEALFRAYGFENPEDFKKIDPRDAESPEDLRARLDAVDTHLQHVIDQVGQYWEIKEVVDWNTTFLAKDADGKIHTIVVDDQYRVTHDFPSDYKFVWRIEEEDGRQVYKELLQVNDEKGLQVVGAENIRNYEPPRIALETGQLLGDLTFVLNNVRFVTVDRDGVNSPIAYGIPKSLDKIGDYEHVIDNVFGNADKPQLDLHRDTSQIAGGAQPEKDTLITRKNVMGESDIIAVKDQRLGEMTKAVYENRSEVRRIASAQAAAAPIAVDETLNAAIQFLQSAENAELPVPVIYRHRLPTPEEVALSLQLKNVTIILDWDLQKYGSVSDRQAALEKAGLTAYVGNNQFRANLLDRETSATSISALVHRLGEKRAVVVENTAEYLRDGYMHLQARKIERPLPGALVLGIVEGDLSALPPDLRIFVNPQGKQFGFNNSAEVNSLLNRAIYARLVEAAA